MVTALVGVGAVLLAVVAYVPALGADFFSDDFVYVVHNRALQALPLRQIWRVFANLTNPYEYLPVRDLSYRLDLAAFGLWPAGFRLHNLALYVAACGAAWACARALLEWDDDPRLGEAGRSWASALAVALFALHPAHAESVAWIAGRKDLLSGLFGLLAVMLFARAIRPDRPDCRALLAAYGAYVLALLSKLTSLPVVVVALLLAARRMHEGGSPGDRRRLVVATAPLVVLAAGALAVGLGVGRATEIRADPFSEALLARAGHGLPALRILGQLTRIAVWPADTRLFYEIPASGIAAQLLTALGMAAVLAGLAGAGLFWKRGGLAGVGAATFLVLCVPFLQLVPFSTWSFASDRFLFLPVFGLALALARRLAPHPAGRVIGTGACVLLGIATVHQGRAWSSVESLVALTARRAPDSARAQAMYVNAVLIRQGRFDEAAHAGDRLSDPMDRMVLRRYAEAWRALEAGDLARGREAAVFLESFVYPLDARSVSFLLGQLAEQRGDTFEAVRHYHAVSSRFDTESDQASQALARLRAGAAPRLAGLRNAVERNPGDWVSLGNLANLEMELFLLDEAEQDYRRLLELRPRLAIAHYDLGLCLRRSGDAEAAAAEIRRSLELGLSTADAWNNLGLARRDIGDVEGAAQAFRSAAVRDLSACDAPINLARLQIALGQRRDAEQTLRQALARPCHDEAKRLIRLRLGQLAELETR